jgi:ATP/maltotriose-dependent transcriptional regulator MalT
MMRTGTTALRPPASLEPSSDFARPFQQRSLALAPSPQTQASAASLTSTRAALGERPALPVPHREALLPEITEPLTARELEVLDLLDRRLTNKEISPTLGVCWQTVARHTKNIFDELRANGRRGSVARAEAVGNLTSTPAPPTPAPSALPQVA